VSVCFIIINYFSNYFLHKNIKLIFCLNNFLNDFHLIKYKIKIKLGLSVDVCSPTSGLGVDTSKPTLGLGMDVCLPTAGLGVDASSLILGLVWMPQTQLRVGVGAPELLIIIKIIITQIIFFLSLSIFLNKCIRNKHCYNIDILA